MRKQAFLCLVAIGAAAWNGPFALAQTDGNVPNPTGLDQPSLPKESSVAVEPALSLPKPTDSMLAPVPAAGRQLRDWSEAMTMIKARSVDLRSAVLDVAVAEGQSRVALASALPSLTASSVYTHQLITRDVQQSMLNPSTGELTQRSSTTPLPDTLSANLQLRQPVFNLRSWYSIGTARLNEEIARLSVDDLRRRLTLSTANTVLSLVTSERVAELNRAALYTALERLELANAKFRNGASTGLDVARAEQDVVSVRASVVSGDESVRQSREALGLALGVAEPIGVRPDLVLDDLAREITGSCQSGSDYRARPDVVAAIKKQELSRRKITDVKLQFAPTIDLQSTLSTSSPTTGLSPSTLWNIQAVFSWAIWEGGARYGALKTTRAQADQVDLQRESLERQVVVGVAQAQRAVAVAQQKVQVAALSRDSAAKIDQMTQKTFRAGLSTSLELVSAAAALRQSELNLAVAEFGLVNSRIALALAMARCPL